jgi:activator of HSP90 ATPase
MAKVGEGDERWIVKEREDGTNVNGWHWKETNLTGWSQSRLKELLGPVVAFEDGTGYAKVTEVEKIEGDVTVQSRKQKKFPLYELEITLKWEGELYDDQGKVKASAKGRVKIPDLSEETYDDLEMTVAVEEETDAKRPLKEAMRKAGSAKVREACMAFVKELKETVNSGQDALKVKVAAPPTERANASYVVAAAEKSKLASIKIKYEFSPPPPVLYETFLDTNRIRGATASDAEISKEVGGKIRLFSGAVEGENVELSPYDEGRGTAVIRWKWRFTTWQPGVHSEVTLTFSEKNGGTVLELTQTGVPDEEKERTEKGWKGLLLDRIKAMLGGSVLK